MASQYQFHGFTLALCLHMIGVTQALAQTGDGGAAQGVQPGDIGSDPGSGTQNAGAAGPDTGSVNLSRGATIAIAVVVSIVVVIVSTTAVLFYLAKKRQWKIKESIRRSARKVSNAVKAVATPLTPKRMTFSPVEKRRHDTDLRRANDQFQKNASPKKAPGESRSSSGDRDLEKGVPGSAVKVEQKSALVKGEEKTRVTKSRDGPKQKPRPPMVSIPSSAFEMDSPKTPVWKKVFGR